MQSLYCSVWIIYVICKWVKKIVLEILYAKLLQKYIQLVVSWLWFIFKWRQNNNQESLWSWSANKMEGSYSTSV